MTKGPNPTILCSLVDKWQASQLNTVVCTSVCVGGDGDGDGVVVEKHTLSCTPGWQNILNCSLGRQNVLNSPQEHITYCPLQCQECSVCASFLFSPLPFTWFQDCPIIWLYIYFWKLKCGCNTLILPLVWFLLQQLTKSCSSGKTVNKLLEHHLLHTLWQQYDRKWLNSWCYFKNKVVCVLLCLYSMVGHRASTRMISL